MFKEKIQKLLKGRIPVCAYCSPQPQKMWAGEMRETQITDHYYNLMAKSGVNVVFAHEEIIGTETEAEAFAALELSKKYDLAYFVKDALAQEFISLGKNGHKHFKELTIKERENLGERFAKSLERYCNFDAFAGITFIDEPGMDMFDGVAFAHSIFKKVCPDKIFYVNMYPNWVYPCQFEYGPQNEGFTTLSDIATEKNKLLRYEKFCNLFLDTVRPEVFSYDAYPVLSLGEFDKMIHTALFEHLAYANSVLTTRKIPFLNFIQAGGIWEGNKNVRVPTYAEVALQINASIVYGAAGVEIFPYSFPACWASDPDAEAGLIGRDGLVSPLYSTFAKILSQVQACAKVLLNAQFEKIIAVGQYEKNDMKKLLEVKDCDCIFNGNIPLALADTSYGKIMHMFSSGQVIAGCYFYGDKKALYLTNTSSQKGVDLTVYSMDGISGEMIQNAKIDKYCGKTVNISLGAGEACLLIVNSL